LPKELQVNLQQIILKFNRQQSQEKINTIAQKIRQKLAQGESFTMLAIRYSNGLHAKNGGNRGWVNINSLPKIMIQSINHLTPGHVSQILSIHKDFYIIKVLGKRQGFTITQQQRKAISQLLFQRQLLEALQTWIKQVRANAYVKIIPTEYQ